MCGRIAGMCVVVVCSSTWAADTQGLKGAVPEQFKTIIAALETRDADLRNLEVIDVAESITNLNLADNSSSMLSKRSRTIRRLGDKTFLSGLTYDYETHSKVLAEFAVNWDGHRAKAYTRWHDETPAPQQEGQIHDAEMDIVKQMRYMCLLGLRMPTSGETMPQFLARCSGVEGKASVSSEANGDRTLVRVAVGDPEWPTVTHTLWFDPEKGFSPVKYRYDDGANWEEHEVLRTKQVDGIWLPMEILARSGLRKDPGIETHTRFVVGRATLGKVRDSDMTVEFPPGTSVVDFVGNIAYRVLPSGQKEFLPLGDPRTGKVFDPRQRPLDEALKDTDAQQVASRPGAPAPMTPSAAPVPAVKKAAIEEEAQEKNQPWGVIVSMATVIAAMAVVLFVLYNRRRAARPGDHS